MNSLLFKRYIAAAILTLAAAASSAQARFGFVASFDAPSSVVSQYDEDFEQFSVALRPKSKIYLSNRLLRKPRATASSYELGTVRLNWNYYERGDVRKSMVPISVDAKELLKRRAARATDLAFLEGGFRALDDDRERRRGGLGISVGLPKRLDRIFGEGGAGLKVAGYRKITFAGRSQWTDAAESETFRQNKFPSLRMEQISRFDITGNIGSKITVKVSQDSQTDIPLANRIQIRYKGDDDDVLKSIEAGNTTLSLPNTQFVGYSSRIRGLFGIKAEAQLGKLSLTAIASQEKGSSERASVTAAGEENATFIRDNEYVQRRIFDLGLPGELARTDVVTDLRVYETVSLTPVDPDAVDANLWADPANPGAYDEDLSNPGQLKVKELFESDFEFFNDTTRGLHYVVFGHSRSASYSLGYWMEVTRANGSVDTIGNIDGNLYDLKLLAPEKTLALPDQRTWPLMWRNCYTIPRTADIEDIKVKIFKGLAGTEESGDNREYQQSNAGTANYIEILGLDQYDKSEVKNPDGLLDARQDVFRPEWGLIIFPSRTPFDSDTTFVHKSGIETPELAVKVPTLYDYSASSVLTQNSEYYIRIITTARSSVVKLDRANIIEGSENITVNGRKLARGTDYEISYEIGRITLLDDEATDPNSSLTIDYEYAPFFALQKKTLLGARAEYNWSRDFQFGSTLLYKSDKTQERKPKVGQETARTVILDGDISLKLHPNFLTSLVDAVPFVESETPSNVSIIAEVAQSRPNPNVDGVAYVDDFESALEELSLGTTRTQWKHASEPYVLSGQDFLKTKMLWHTPRELVQVEDVYDRETAQGEGTLRTLRMIFRPDTAGASSWSGIMRYFGSRVDSSRAKLFEVRLRADQNIESRLHFDFGIINEDLNNDGTSFTEDVNANGAVDETEDVGLDGLSDEFEPDLTGNPADPAGDNWYFQGDGNCPVPGGCESIDWDSDEWYYEYLNGTEGNMFDPSVTGLPDRENISPSWTTRDAYFTYSLDLSSDQFLVPNSEKNGWATYRIPIRDLDALDAEVSSSGSPNWNKITHVRVWFESAPGQTDPDTVEIADWFFVQSNWRDSLVYGPDSAASRTKFVVAEMSDDENKDFTPPPGVESYKDPSTNVTEAQRALLLKFEGLRPTDSCMAVKDLISVDRYAGYRSLEMFVYGDYNDSNDEGLVRFFFRLGQDRSNYYEYYTDVYEGWDERNFVKIDFNEITALKDEEQRRLESGVAVNVDNGEHYRIVGAPDINKVRFFAAGLVNTDTTNFREIDGQVWIDELRVTEVRKDVGTAGRVQVVGNLADLVNYSFSFESKDPYFRGLSTSTRGGSTDNLGSGQTSTSYNYGLTFNINKFLPRSWGAQIPISMNYNKSIQTPLLRNNSDIVLPEETRKEEQARRETKRVSVSARFKKKGRNPLFSLLLNRLKTSASYQRTNSKTVTAPYSFGETYNVRSSFDFGITTVPTVPIFFWTKPVPGLNKLASSRLALYPEKWSTSSSFVRTLTVTDDINFNRRSSNSRSFDGRMDIVYNMFKNMNFTYGYMTNRDLSDPDNVNISLSNPKLGLETHFQQNVTAKYDPQLLSFFRTSWSFKANYSDDWQRQYQARRSAMSRTAGVSGEFDHVKLFGEKKKKKKTRRAPIRRGEKTEKKEDGDPFYEPALNVVRTLTNWIDPLAYSYSETYNNSLPGMNGRPSWQYRFGLKDEADIDEAADVVGVRSSTEATRYELSSGFTLLGGVGLRVKYGASVNTDLVKQGARYEKTNINWPDLAIRIQKFKKFPLIRNYLNKFISIFSPRTGFTRRTQETQDIDNGFLTSKTESRAHKPLLSLTLKIVRSLSLAASYTLEKSEKENFSSTTGELQSETHTDKTILAITGRYSFTSPKGISLPILGRVKFNSQVDFEMTVRINTNVTETSQARGPFVISTDKSDYLFSPVIKYSFSRQMTGGLTMRWQDSIDNHRSRKSHTREVQIWTEISF